MILYRVYLLKVTNPSNNFYVWRKVEENKKRSKRVQYETLKVKPYWSESDSPATLHIECQEICLSSLLNKSETT